MAQHASFSPVMDYKQALPLPAIDLRHGYRHDENAPQLIGAGGYLEFRREMYVSPLYAGERFIHMGVDIWGPEGEPVYAFADGQIWGFRNNDNALDYGPTIVTQHNIGGSLLYALYGHLSLESLGQIAEGQKIEAGQKIGALGGRDVNGGWVPHLHFQLANETPAAPDMPGVVSPDELEAAIRRHPDPRMVLGPVYV
ncbi:MAG: peptidoglycan DD-metalloendopeptidase family protein [Cyclonatronaceae bacterium]